MEKRSYKEDLTHDSTQIYKYPMIHCTSPATTASLGQVLKLNAHKQGIKSKHPVRALFRSATDTDSNAATTDRSLECDAVVVVTHPLSLTHTHTYTYGYGLSPSSREASTRSSAAQARRLAICRARIGWFGRGPAGRRRPLVLGHDAHMGISTCSAKLRNEQCCVSTGRPWRGQATGKYMMFVAALG